ncbi:hypothetical protein H310_09620 [Aphanomyces invadans]|uniref:Uncharacterized protein n=1 Tax=Aphanomyces invadans TaxID=157072 RepID=A0A024TSX3_9STRA|nr:hypothetical protein H310_09620 [Aphanomyces invadans]ETV97255.1 hypothetical protein H310_09620 [Aphanomyces invadans]|eukprot:XP_008873963.1 hypothetical protein H310_09620 [Aphanomyces invadans]
MTLPSAVQLGKAAAAVVMAPIHGVLQMTVADWLSSPWRVVVAGMPVADAHAAGTGDTNIWPAVINWLGEHAPPFVLPTAQMVAAIVVMVSFWLFPSSVQSGNDLIQASKLAVHDGVEQKSVILAALVGTSSIIDDALPTVLVQLAHGAAIDVSTMTEACSEVQAAP